MNFMKTPCRASGLLRSVWPLSSPSKRSETRQAREFIEDTYEPNVRFCKKGQRALCSVGPFFLGRAPPPATCHLPPATCLKHTLCGHSCRELFRMGRLDPGTPWLVSQCHPSRWRVCRSRVLTQRRFRASDLGGDLG